MGKDTVAIRHLPVRAILFVNFLLLALDSTHFGVRFYEVLSRAHISNAVLYLAVWCVFSTIALFGLLGLQIQARVRQRRSGSSGFNSVVLDAGICIDFILTLIWVTALLLVSARAGAGVL
jgi:hypothetical protein